MKCKVCKKNISNADLKDDIAIKICYNNANIYFCSDKHCSEFFIKVKTTMAEQKTLDEIDKLVRKDIFNYEDNQKLPKVFYTRIKDLENGVFKNSDRKLKNNTKGGYPIDIILKTFELNKDTIIDAFHYRLTNANEGQRINYMMAIIDNHINDVYIDSIRYKKQEQSEKNIDVLEIIPTHVSKDNTPKKPLSFIDEDDL